MAEFETEIDPQVSQEIQPDPPSKALYNALVSTNKYNLPSYDQFSADMKDVNKRKKLLETVKGEGLYGKNRTLSDFNTHFFTDIDSKKKVGTQTSSPVVAPLTQPSATTPNSLLEASNNNLFVPTTQGFSNSIAQSQMNEQADARNVNQFLESPLPENKPNLLTTPTKPFKPTQEGFENKMLTERAKELTSDETAAQFTKNVDFKNYAAAAANPMTGAFFNNDPNAGVTKDQHEANWIAENFGDTPQYQADISQKLNQIRQDNPDVWGTLMTRTGDFKMSQKDKANFLENAMFERGQRTSRDMGILEARARTGAKVDDVQVSNALERHNRAVKDYKDILINNPDEANRRKTVKAKNESLTIKDSDGTGTKIMKGVGQALSTIQNKVIDAGVSLISFSKDTADALAPVSDAKKDTYSSSDKLKDGIVSMLNGFKAGESTDYEDEKDLTGKKNESFSRDLLGTVTDMALLYAGGRSLGGGRGATTIYGAAQQYEGFRQTAADAGLSEKQARNYAFALAFTQGALENVNPSLGFLKMGSQAEKMALKEAVAVLKANPNITSQDFSKRIIGKVFEYGDNVVKENAQEIMQSLAEKASNSVANEVLEGDKFDDKVTAEEITKTVTLTSAATIILSALTRQKISSRDIQAAEVLNENEDAAALLNDLVKKGEMSFNDAQSILDFSNRVKAKKVVPSETETAVTKELPTKELEVKSEEVKAKGTVEVPQTMRIAEDNAVKELDAETVTKEELLNEKIVEPTEEVKKTDTPAVEPTAAVEPTNTQQNAEEKAPTADTAAASDTKPSGQGQTVEPTAPVTPERPSNFDETPEQRTERIKQTVNNAKLSSNGKKAALGLINQTPEGKTLSVLPKTEQAKVNKVVSEVYAQDKANTRPTETTEPTTPKKASVPKKGTLQKGQKVGANSKIVNDFEPTTLKEEIEQHLATGGKINEADFNAFFGDGKGRTQEEMKTWKESVDPTAKSIDQLTEGSTFKEQGQSAKDAFEEILNENANSTSVKQRIAEKKAQRDAVASGKNNPFESEDYAKNQQEQEAKKARHTADLDAQNTNKKVISQEDYDAYSRFASNAEDTEAQYESDKELAAKHDELYQKVMSDPQYKKADGTFDYEKLADNLDNGAFEPDLLEIWEFNNKNKIDNGTDNIIATAKRGESNAVASKSESGTSDQIGGNAEEQERGIEPSVLTEEEYLSYKGFGRGEIGEAALHKNKGNNSDKTWRKMVESQAVKDRAVLAKREELRKEYAEKVALGEIRPPTRNEVLIKTANGNEDNASVQAARNLLEKRGIEWRGKYSEPKTFTQSSRGSETFTPNTPTEIDEDNLEKSLSDPQAHIDENLLALDDAITKAELEIKKASKGIVTANFGLPFGAGAKLFQSYVNLGYLKFKKFLYNNGKPMTIQDMATALKTTVNENLTKVYDQVQRIWSIENSSGFHEAMGYAAQARVIVQDKYLAVKTLYKDLAKMGVPITDDVNFAEMQELQTSKIADAQKRSTEWFKGMKGGDKIRGTEDSKKKSWVGRVIEQVGDYNAQRDYMYAKHALDYNARAREIDAKQRSAEIEPLQSEADELTDQFVAETDPKLQKTLQEKIIKLNNKIAEIQNEPTLDKPSGMTDIEANDILAEAAKDADKMAKMDDLAKEFRENTVIKKIDLLEASGVINAETAQNMREGKREGYTTLMPNYLPLKVRSENFSERMRPTMSMHDAALIKSISGTDAYDKTQRYDPLQMAMTELHAAQSAAMNNESLTALYNAVKQSPFGQNIKIINSRGTYAANELGALADTKTEPKVGVRDLLNEHAIGFKVDGKIKYIFFTPIKNADGKLQRHPVMEAINRDPRGYSSLTKAFLSLSRALSNYLRLIRTTYNVGFAVDNPFRDIGEALANISDIGKDQAETEKIRLAIIKNTPTSFGFFFNPSKKRFSFSRKGVTVEQVKEFEGYWDEMRSEGVPMSWGNYGGIDEKIDDFQKDIDRMNNGKFGKTGKEKALTTFQVLGALSEATENTTRLSVFAAMRQNGYSVQKAAYVAKNITLNFEKGGTGTLWTNTLWMFSNAGIQGAARMARAAKSKNFWRFGAAMTAFAFANRAALLYGMEDDDENKWIYNNIENQGRTMIFNPFDPKNPIRLPKPYSAMRIFLNTGEGMADVMHGKRTLGDVIGNNIASTLASSVDPIGGSSNSLTVYTPFEPLRNFVQIQANENWAGQEIMRGQDNLENKEVIDHLRSNPNTAPVFDKAALGIYEKTGASIQPTTLEYFWDDYGKNAVKSVKDYADLGGAVIDHVTGKEVKAESIPAIKRFYTNVDDKRGTVLYGVMDLVKDPTQGTKEQIRYIENQLPKLKADATISRYFIAKIEKGLTEMKDASIKVKKDAKDTEDFKKNIDLKEQGQKVKQIKGK